MAAFRSPMHNLPMQPTEKNRRRHRLLHDIFPSHTPPESEEPLIPLIRAGGNEKLPTGTGAGRELTW